MPLIYCYVVNNTKAYWLKTTKIILFLFPTVQRVDSDHLGSFTLGLIKLQSDGAFLSSLMLAAGGQLRFWLGFDQNTTSGLFMLPVSLKHGS